MSRFPFEIKLEIEQQRYLGGILVVFQQLLQQTVYVTNLAEFRAILSVDTHLYTCTDLSV